jgi:ribonuclease BN (tRNA processing enzyme)
MVVTRVTIIGSGTSAPQADTPASGVLVETGSTAVLIDCGQGVIRGMMPIRDPRNLDAIIVGHLHADHYIDIVSLRYLLPWAGFTGTRTPILLPPGGRTRMDELAAAISERPGFFDHTFDVREYDPAAALTIGDLDVGFLPGRHYVPAWGCRLRDAAGRVVIVSGDTGPNPPLVDAARGADLLVVEATLLEAAEDDPKRGHLTVAEAVAVGIEAGVGRTILVHHRSQNHEAVLAAARASVTVEVGRPGLVVELEGIARGTDRGTVGHGLGEGDGGDREPSTEPGGTSASVVAAS